MKQLIVFFLFFSATLMSVEAVRAAENNGHGIWTDPFSLAGAPETGTVYGITTLGNTLFASEGDYLDVFDQAAGSWTRIKISDILPVQAGHSVLRFAVTNGKIVTHETYRDLEAHDNYQRNEYEPRGSSWEMTSSTESGADVEGWDYLSLGGQLAFLELRRQGAKHVLTISYDAGGGFETDLFNGVNGLLDGVLAPPARILGFDAVENNGGYFSLLVNDGRMISQVDLLPVPVVDSQNLNHIPYFTGSGAKSCQTGSSCSFEVNFYDDDNDEILAEVVQSDGPAYANRSITANCTTKGNQAITLKITDIDGNGTPRSEGAEKAFSISCVTGTSSNSPYISDNNVIPGPDESNSSAQSSNPQCALSWYASTHVNECFGGPANNCKVAPGDPDYCFTCGPCGEGEGGCHFDWQCENGLVCDQNSTLCVNP